MSQSLSQIYLHCVFSTKNRCGFLNNQEIREDLYAYISGIIKKQQCKIISIGGIEDHVHILLNLNRGLNPAKLIAHIKRDSTKWIRLNHTTLKDFYWQKGYGCFSVSHRLLDATIQYIKHQEKHHRRFDFKEEFILLCKKHQIQFDRQYLFD